jgi:hypothetical protein
MSSGFWAGSVPSWGLVCGGCLCVLFLLLGLWFGVGRRDRVYDAGYDDGQADERDRAGVAMVRAAGMRAWELTHPAELQPLPDKAVKQFQALVTHSELEWERGGFGEDAVRDGELEEWAVPLEYPPAPPVYAWEPWSLSADTTLEEEVAAMIANANQAPSVRWLETLHEGAEP